MDIGIAIGLLVARVAVGGFIAAHGTQKLTHRFGGGGLEATGEELRDDGFVGGRLTALLVGGAQLGGGALLVVGLATPLGAVLVIATMVMATIVKRHAGFWSQRGGYEYPLLLALLGIALAFTGPGALSLDALLGIASWHSWGVGLAAGAIGVGGALLARVILYRRRLDRRRNGTLG